MKIDGGIVDIKRVDCKLAKSVIRGFTTLSFQMKLYIL